MKNGQLHVIIFASSACSSAKKEFKGAGDGLESSQVYEWWRVIKTYQSQVITTAVQSCDHHLLINNPYWARETDKDDCVNAL